jgi:hypothetical protein
MAKFVNKVVFGIEVLYIWRKFTLRCKVINLRLVSQEYSHANTDPISFFRQVF